VTRNSSGRQRDLIDRPSLQAGCLRACAAKGPFYASAAAHVAVATHRAPCHHKRHDRQGAPSVCDRLSFILALVQVLLQWRRDRLCLWPGRAVLDAVYKATETVSFMQGDLLMLGAFAAGLHLT
jgi:hypothetical protein